MLEEKREKQKRFENYVLSCAMTAGLVALLFGIEMLKIPILHIVAEILLFPGVVLSGWLVVGVDSDYGRAFLPISLVLDVLLWAWPVMEVWNRFRRKNIPL